MMNITINSLPRRFVKTLARRSWKVSGSDRCGPVGEISVEQHIETEMQEMVVYPLPETNSEFALKIDGWKIIFSFWGKRPIFWGCKRCSNFPESTTDFGTVVLTDMKRSRYNKIVVFFEEHFFSGNGPQFSGNYTASKLVRKSLHFVFELDNFCLLAVWNPPFTVHRIIQDFWPIQPVIDESGNLNTRATIQRLQPAESQ